jgi:outer membrane protein OmpA-like peptidoglycan-associated protein
MKRVSFILLGIIFLSVLTCGVAMAADQDAKGCKDHALFTRMPGYHIAKCEEKDFDHYTFFSEKGKKTDVEGHYTMLWYKTNEGVKAASPLAVIRNHQQAIKSVGGKVLFEDNRYTTLQFAKNGKEVWAQIDTAWGSGYQIYLVEKQEMAQEVVANAASFSNDLKDSGHTAIYGIYFDTGQSEIKPESKTAFDEIAKLLKDNPGLKVNIVGHTDNVGERDYNMKLSKARADSVAKELISKYGIDAGRIAAYGVGPLAPVAANKTEEGRAKNRRVELVEQ